MRVKWLRANGLREEPRACIRVRYEAVPRRTVKPTEQQRPVPIYFFCSFSLGE
jgi:hypothetical protein